MSTPSFRHVYRPGTGTAPYSLLLLHGPGGDEQEMVPLAEKIVAGAAVGLSIRDRRGNSGSLLQSSCFGGE
jgi:predicted esterase